VGWFSDFIALLFFAGNARSVGWLVLIYIAFTGILLAYTLFPLLHTHSVLAELERCLALNVARIRRDEIRRDEKSRGCVSTDGATSLCMFIESMSIGLVH